MRRCRDTAAVSAVTIILARKQSDIRHMQLIYHPLLYLFVYLAARLYLHITCIDIYFIILCICTFAAALCLWKVSINNKMSLFLVENTYLKKTIKGKNNYLPQVTV